MDDAEITRDAFLAADGDREAAHRFVAATQAQLHRLLSYLSTPRVAEDLMQETYLRAFSALPGYAGRSPARMWLLAIGRRVAADHLRTQQRRPRTAELDDWIGVAEGAGATTADHSRLVALRQVVAQLEPERREAFVLTQMLGLAYADAAEVCGCVVGTIRSRVFRAREDLAIALGDGGEQRPAAHG